MESAAAEVCSARAAADGSVWASPRLAVSPALLQVLSIPSPSLVIPSTHRHHTPPAPQRLRLCPSNRATCLPCSLDWPCLQLLLRLPPHILAPSSRLSRLLTVFLRLTRKSCDRSSSPRLQPRAPAQRSALPQFYVERAFASCRLPSPPRVVQTVDSCYGCCRSGTAAAEHPSATN